MHGEQVVLNISSEEKRHPGEENLVWWKPTAANAEALVDLYSEKIHGSHPKSLVYVPTIEHGNLFFSALEKRFGEGYGRFAHSKMSDGDFLESIRHWQANGGPLISIKRLGRGFRATGAYAVFHTYQTTSPELYAQRTGRAWAKTEASIPDLYVLEVAWNRRGCFANLARLLGLIDYPGPSVFSRKLKPLLAEQRKRSEKEEKLRDQVRQGEVSPVFVGIPLQETWRRRFVELLRQTGGI